MKYRYYHTPNQVVCVSTFAQKNVRGVATCASEDEFDLKTGEELAKLRCDKAISEKRKKCAARKLKAATEAFEKAKKDYDYYVDYYVKSTKESDELASELSRLEKKLSFSTVKTEEKKTTTTRKKKLTESTFLPFVEEIG